MKFSKNVKTKVEISLPGMKEIPQPTHVLPTEVVPTDPAVSAQKEDNVVRAGTTLGAAIAAVNPYFLASAIDLFTVKPIILSIAGVSSIANPLGLAMLPAGLATGYAVSRIVEGIGRSTKQDVAVDTLIPAEIVDETGFVSPAVAKKTILYKDVPSIEVPDLKLSTRMNQAAQETALPVRIVAKPMPVAA